MEKLRTDPIEMTALDIAGSSDVRLPFEGANQMEIEVEFVLKNRDLPASVGLKVLASATLQHYTFISMNVSTAGSIVALDRSKSLSEGPKGLLSGPLVLLNEETTLTLRVFIDNSVIDAFFMNGRHRISAYEISVISLYFNVY